MQNFTSIVMIFYLLLSIPANAQESSKVKRALLIGIGNYPEEKGWPQISSIRDVDLIKQALLRQGFDPKNVEEIKDSQATKNKILDKIGLLTDHVNKGDIVIIHFSSHGEQVQDLNGDEADGFDESIVGYGAISPKKSADFMKDRVDYLLDDELGDSMRKLRKKLGSGGDLLVFMDLCHSGTGTRGSAKVRGGQPPLTISKSQQVPKNGTSLFSEDIKKDDDADLSSFTVISAAKANELDYEIVDDDNVGMGSLSYAITKAFEELEPNTNYYGLYAKIQSIMNNKSVMQHPVIEGTDLNRKIFGGSYSYQHTYSEIESVLGKNIIINSGSLAGFSVGSLIAVYPAGTSDFQNSKPLSTGKVISSTLFNAEIQVDTAIQLKPSEGWVVNKLPKYSLPTVRLQLMPSTSTSFDAKEREEIKKLIAQIPAVQISNPAELLLVKGDMDDTLKIAATGSIFSLANSTNLVGQLTTYCQYKFLKSVEAKQNDMDVSIVLARLSNGFIDTISNRTTSGYEFYEGDTMKVIVHNNSKQVVYVNILDIQPDGRINAVFPNKKKDIYSDELFVERESVKIFPKVLKVSPPYGTEVFKVFISTKEIDVENIAASRGADTRGNLSFLEYLVKRTYSSSRGVEAEEPNAKKDGYTANIVFEIKPRSTKN